MCRKNAFCYCNITPVRKHVLLNVHTVPMSLSPWRNVTGWGGEKEQDTDTRMKPSVPHSGWCQLVRKGDHREGSSQSLCSTLGKCGMTASFSITAGPKERLMKDPGRGWGSYRHTHLSGHFKSVGFSRMIVHFLNKLYFRDRVFCKVLIALQ